MSLADELVIIAEKVRELERGGIIEAVSEPGQFLALARNRKKLSQEQLAELAGVSVNTIGNLESGKNVRPRVRTLMAIAEQLDIPWQTLYRGGGSDEGTDQE